MWARGASQALSGGLRLGCRAVHGSERLNEAAVSTALDEGFALFATSEFEIASKKSLSREPTETMDCAGLEELCAREEELLILWTNWSTLLRCEAKAML